MAGLNSHMQKIVSFTSKLNATLNPQRLINVSLPGVNLGKMFGVEELEGVQTLGDLVNTIEDVGGDIMTGVNLLRCAGKMNMSDWGQWLGQLGMGVTSIIASIVDVVIEAIAIQISAAVQQIVGAITSIVSALHNLVTSVGLLLEGLGDFWKSLTWDVDFDFDWDLSEKNCKDMYAAIAGCFLNKFLGDYFEEFKQKAVEMINEGGSAFNDFLYAELSDVHTFAAYANQEAFLLEKAKIQISGLRKEVLAAAPPLPDYTPTSASQSTTSTSATPANNNNTPAASTGGGGTNTKTPTNTNTPAGGATPSAPTSTPTNNNNTKK